MKTNQQIRDEVSNSNVRTHRLLLMLWDELEDFKHVFLWRNDEPPEVTRALHDHHAPDHNHHED